MKYLLLMYGAEDQWTDAERRDCMAESLGVCAELTARGEFLATSPLQSVATAATVRVRGGQALVTDGPFAETTEQLGGYFLLDLPDLDAAIAVAARLPPARKGAVEIRPLLALDGLPPRRPFPAGTSAPGLTAFLLLCHHDESAWDDAGPDALQLARAEAAARCRELSAEGRYLNASPLHPAATATCVRVRDGKRLITDGPFTETREVLGGFYVVLAESRADALRLAGRQPGARHGAVEVRPLFDLAAMHTSVSIS